jgi:hypothetical protein
VKKPKPEPKNKGGRPRKVAVLATGKEAVARFVAGMRHVLQAGPDATEK